MKKKGKTSLIKLIKTLYLIVGIIFLIISIYNIITIKRLNSNMNLPTDIYKTSVFITLGFIIYTIGSFISYIMASKEKKIAGVIGIITGILMVLGTIYSSLLVLTVGIIMIVFSKSYLECFK